MLKEIFSDDKIVVSDVDEDALNKYINSNDASAISEIISDALIDMGIEYCEFSWDINVSIVQEK